MVTIKEFIKENSAPAPKKAKKKRRIRLKNFNPFRKRKYRSLDEEISYNAMDGHDNDPCSPNENLNNLDNMPSGKRHRLQRFFKSARHNFKVDKHRSETSSDNTLNFRAEKRSRKRPRQTSGSSQYDYECLLGSGGEYDSDVSDDTVSIDTFEIEDVTTDDDENRRSANKRVVFSEDIDVIEIAAEGPPKKSRKKRLKKAGMRTMRLIGHGLSNVAMSFQYLSPMAAIVPVTREMKNRDTRYYKELTLAASLSYIATG